MYPYLASTQIGKSGGGSESVEVIVPPLLAVDPPQGQDNSPPKVVTYRVQCAQVLAFSCGIEVLGSPIGLAGDTSNTCHFVLTRMPSCQIFRVPFMTSVRHAAAFFHPIKLTPASLSNPFCVISNSICKLIYVGALSPIPPDSRPTAKRKSLWATPTGDVHATRSRSLRPHTCRTPPRSSWHRCHSDSSITQSRCTSNRSRPIPNLGENSNQASKETT